MHYSSTTALFQVSRHAIAVRASSACPVLVRHCKCGRAANLHLPLPVRTTGLAATAASALPLALPLLFSPAAQPGRFASCCRAPERSTFALPPQTPCSTPAPILQHYTPSVPAPGLGRGGTPSQAHSPSPATPAATLASHCLRHRCTALSSAARHHPDPSYGANCQHHHIANSACMGKTLHHLPHLLCRSACVYCTRSCV